MKEREGKLELNLHWRDACFVIRTISCGQYLVCNVEYSAVNRPIHTLFVRVYAIPKVTVTDWDARYMLRALTRLERVHYSLRDPISSL